jgi:hypothetical protein
VLCRATNALLVLWHVAAGGAGMRRSGTGSVGEMSVPVPSVHRAGLRGFE